MDLVGISDLKMLAKSMRDCVDSASQFLDIVDELKERLSKGAYKKAINEIYA